METTGREFAIAVNLPRSYMGRAGLRVGADSVTLVARPIRYFRTIVYSCIGADALLMVPALAMPWSLEIRAVVYGVLSGLCWGVVFWRLRSSGGESRSMDLPLTAVSLAKRNSRVLVLSAAFEGTARSRSWVLVADTRDDAEAIASALTAAGE